MSRLALAAVAAVAAIVVAVPATAQSGYRVDQQGKDALWDITSKMEMPGMPMALPAQSHRVCVVKGSDEEGIPKKDECKVVDAKRAGNKLSYKMACKGGKDDYTATGATEWSGNGYQGRMQMAGKIGGEQMDMTMSYSGNRVGNCTSTTNQDVAVVKTRRRSLAAHCEDMLLGITQASLSTDSFISATWEAAMMPGEEAPAAARSEVWANAA